MEQLLTLEYIWKITQYLAAFVFIGFGILGLYLRSEFNYLKKALAVVLAANPEMAKQVAQFTKGGKEDAE